MSYELAPMAQRPYALRRFLNSAFRIPTSAFKNIPHSHFRIPYMPHPRYHRVAKFAFVSNQIIGWNKIAPALDQQLSAIVAVGVVALVPGHVAHINIANAFGHCQFPITAQG